MMDTDIQWGSMTPRTDWLTAQHVDEAIDLLATGAHHEKVRVFMAGKLIPPTVQRRVLAGQAARRHRDTKFNF